MSKAQRVIAAIVAVITVVMLLESYGAMVDAARTGGRAIPELWPLGTEALALAMEVSVLEAKRLGHQAVLRLSWVLLVASLALSTMLQVAVAPPSLVGYVTAGATPVWLLGSFAVLSLLYRAGVRPDTAPGVQPNTEPDTSDTERTNERPPPKTRRRTPKPTRPVDQARLSELLQQGPPDGGDWTVRTLADALGCAPSTAAPHLAAFKASRAPVSANGSTPHPEGR